MLILVKAQALTTRSQLCQETAPPVWKLDRIPPDTRAPKCNRQSLKTKAHMKMEMSPEIVSQTRPVEGLKHKAVVFFLLWSPQKDWICNSIVRVKDFVPH